MKWNEQSIIEYINNNIEDHLSFKEIILFNKFYTKFTIYCSIHNIITKLFFSEFKSNKQRCKQCGIETRNNNKKLKYEDIKKYLLNNDYELLESEIKNIRQKIKVRCLKCGNIYLMNFDNFKNKNKKCAQCSGNKKIKYQEVKNYIENMGYILHTKETERYNKKITITCNNNHTYTTTFYQVKHGSRCFKCDLDKFNNIDYVNSVQKKIYITKKQNSSFHTSKQEDEVYILLKEKCPDVIRQYKDDLYPFTCDFYIPSLKMYIEYHGTWTHGGEPYNENKKEHQEKLLTWSNKNTDFYNQAIYTWTDLDIRKREMAKINNLNYIEFYSILDLKEFLNDMPGMQ